MTHEEAERILLEDVKRIIKMKLEDNEGMIGISHKVRGKLLTVRVYVKSLKEENNDHNH